MRAGTAACVAELVAAPDAGSNVTVRSGKVIVALPGGGGAGLERSFGGSAVAGVAVGTDCIGGTAEAGVGDALGPAPAGPPSAPGRVGLPGTTTGLWREGIFMLVAALELVGGGELAGGGAAEAGGAWPLRDGALERAAAACCSADGCLLGSREATGGVVCGCCGGGGVGGFWPGAASAVTGGGSELVLGTPAAAAAEALNFARVLRYSCSRWFCEDGCRVTCSLGKGT